MPAVAVGAAVFAGVEIATVGLAAMSTFGAIAAIGAVAAGVGVVTGNSELMKIGSIMGLVGGVGALATNAGLIGGGIGEAPGGAIGTDISAAAGAEASADGLIGPVMADAAPVIETGQAVIPTVDATPSVLAGSATPPPGPAAALNAEASNVSAAQPGASAAAPTQPAGGLINQGAPSGAEGVMGGTSPAAGGAMAGPTSPLDFIKGALEQSKGFVKENQMLSYGMMQTGGQFLAGLFDPLKPAQQKYLEAQTALLEARNANMGQPLPTASTAPGPRAPVFNGGATPPTYRAPTVGLINVTGRPA